MPLPNLIAKHIQMPSAAVEHPALTYATSGDALNAFTEITDHIFDIPHT